MKNQNFRKFQNFEKFRFFHYCNLLIAEYYLIYHYNSSRVVKYSQIKTQNNRQKYHFLTKLEYITKFTKISKISIFFEKIEKFTIFLNIIIIVREYEILIINYIISNAKRKY